MQNAAPLEQQYLPSLVAIAALGAGLIAGVFFAFSSFVMGALGRLPAAQGIAAMQSINIVVVNPVFMTALFGTAVLCALLAAWALRVWQSAGAGYLLAGSLLYVGGAALVTIFFNVPLNDALARVDPASASGAEVWGRYLSEWTAWNHVRTAASFLAAAAFTLAFCRIDQVR